jgi:hypothetical protein
MKTKNSRLIKVVSVGVFALSSALLVPFAAHAQTTTPTTPAGVLDPMKDGANDMDDLAGLGAAIGISSTVYGVGSNIFKRFGYG